MKENENKLLTRWGKTLDKENPLPEYPRPQFRRDSYLNLNGQWDYAIYKKTEAFGGWEGRITVPFSPETALSGVGRRVCPEDRLYCRRFFSIPGGFLKERTLLHFGAVDENCVVFLNGREAGRHSGGFLPFSLDVSALIHSGENEVRLEAEDPTDTSWTSRGKQSSAPGGIWYPSQAGIWQTVWLESLPAVHLESIRLSPDIDGERLLISPVIAGAQSVEAAVLDGDRTVAEAALKPGQNEIALPGARLWSPDDPHLYSLRLKAGDDLVESYFGMRKFSLGKDGAGIPRLFLNNRPCFQSGLLDQGYWPDGLLTAPSDEAMIFDIKSMKGLGFNMLRKHIKIEPLRWYYHCDRLGMLVWQDMPSGGERQSLLSTSILPFLGVHSKDGPAQYRKFGRGEEAGREAYYRELDGMVNLLGNVVSLCLWTPFNEGWGQFDAGKAAALLRRLDPSRLVDEASGWYGQGGGDCQSLHVYFRPFRPPRPEAERALVLSEFGGYSHQVEGHVRHPGKVFGYRKCRTLQDFQRDFAALYNGEIVPAVQKGLAASVYTQLSDVEDEVNGLLSYDREVCKVDQEETKRINSALYQALGLNADRKTLEQCM
jgi:hypothetical protein